MKRWTGFTNQVSDDSNFTNCFVDALNISKSVGRDASGNQIITKRHGMYQKKIYNQMNIAQQETNQYYFISNFEGVDGGTGWPEEHPLLPDLVRQNPVPYPGYEPVFLTNTDRKFGNTSLIFNTATDVTSGEEVLWSWGSSNPIVIRDFTIEMWIKFKGIWPLEGYADRWVEVVLQDTNTPAYFYWSVAGYLENPLRTSWVIRDYTGSELAYEGEHFIFIKNQWQHLAIVCRGKVIKVFLGGIFKHTWTSTVSNPFRGVNNFYIQSNATRDGATDAVLFDGLSFSASARWTKDFTPPKKAPSI